MKNQNTIIQVELTNHCNTNCWWCRNNQMKRRKGFISLDLVKQIIEKIKDRQDYILLHFYGESFLHPYLLEIIELFYKSGIKTGLCTNGSLLTDQMINDLTKSHLQDIFFTMNKMNVITSRNQIEKLRKKSGLNIMVSIINLPKKAPNKIKALEIFEWVEQIKKKTNKIIRITAQGYENPDTKECSYKQRGECTFRRNNQYWILWNGDLITCVKDYEGETKVGTIKDLNKVKYKNNLCPF